MTLRQPSGHSPGSGWEKAEFTDGRLTAAREGARQQEAATS